MMAMLGNVWPVEADGDQRPVIRWGIVGTGSIANSMAEVINTVSSAKLVAVSSRRMESARKFAAKHGAEHTFDDWAEMLASYGIADLDNQVLVQEMLRDVAMSGVPLATDMGEITCSSKDGDQTHGFVNAAGAGFDANNNEECANEVETGTFTPVPTGYVTPMLVAPSHS